MEAEGKSGYGKPGPFRARTRPLEEYLIKNSGLHVYLVPPIENVSFIFIPQ